LRSLEKLVREKNRVLERQRDQLVATLKANNIPISDDLVSPPPPAVPFYLSSSSSMDSSGWSDDSGTGSPILSVDLSCLSAVTPQPSYGKTAAERIPEEVDLSLLTPHGSCNVGSTADFDDTGHVITPETHMTVPMTNLDAQAGVNFILA